MTLLLMKVIAYAVSGFRLRLFGLGWPLVDFHSPAIDGSCLTFAQFFHDFVVVEGDCLICFRFSAATIWAWLALS